MSKVIEKTTEKLPKYMRRLTGGTYEARKMINGRTIFRTDLSDKRSETAPDVYYF